MLIINESNFIVKDTVTSTFETILTESPTGLIAAASSGVVKIAGLSLGFIVSAAIIVVAKFYMVLRNNSYAYRNALVIIYEFYVTKIHILLKEFKSFLYNLDKHFSEINEKYTHNLITTFKETQLNINYTNPFEYSSYLLISLKDIS